MKTSFFISVTTPAQVYSQNRLSLLDRLYRHPSSLATQTTFLPFTAYKHTRCPSRAGRPKPHWVESCLVGASQRLDRLISDEPPPHSHMGDFFYSIPTAPQIREVHSSHGLFGWKPFYAAKFPQLPDKDFLGPGLRRKHAAHPISASERSVQTGPSLDPALATKVDLVQVVVRHCQMSKQELAPHCATKLIVPVLTCIYA